MYKLVTFDYTRNRTEKIFNTYSEAFLVLETILDDSTIHEAWVTSLGGTIISWRVR